MSYRTIPKTPSAYAYPLLIKNIIEAPMAYAPDQEIVYRDKIRYNYRTLRSRIGQLANVLKSLGVQPGTTVAVMDWDSHRYLECFFAIPMMGAVLHTINIRLSPEQLVYTINHAEDDVILVNSDFLPMLEPVRDQISRVKKFIILTDLDQAPSSSLPVVGEYESLLKQQPAAYDFPDFDENTMATTFYTTGTTGLPKGVYFSHRQLVMHTYALMSGLCAYKSQLKLDSGDVYMPLTPMFHVHAWGIPYLCTMLGTKQVYPGKYEPPVLLKLIMTEKVTFSHCVPTIIHMLVSSPAIKSVDLSHWKVIIGGSALPKGLCKAAMALGINLTSAYGMSETCPLLTAANMKPYMLDWDIDKQVTIRCRTGLAVPLVHLEIVDPEGKPVPHDGKATGEVVVRAPWLTQGYLKDPEKSEMLWERGWLHTGDIGFIDPEGYLQITDRVKDVIKTGGEWISSLQLEDIISQHPAVSEAAVIGIPDEKWGERPMAMVVLREGYKGKITEEELKQFYMKSVDEGLIPKYGVPSKIAIVDTIAKTSVGKINKKQLRQDYKR
ncbi:fatty acid--CoA ligase [Desulfatirhabdium butyrativorans]|uniref:fatty acid--CoA ligase n=1 Tax=Desulfatirhabdium butyrativorans TaxID=340467 RepID=UPI00041621A8|nr:fatty acid--CoA ligase [Desulfatirhabdium butyrativorans]